MVKRHVTDSCLNNYSVCFDGYVTKGETDLFMKQKIRYYAKKPLYLLSCLLSYPVFPLLFFYSHKFGELKYLSYKDCIIWKNAMASFFRTCYKGKPHYPAWRVIYSFLFSQIKVIKKTDIVSDDVPVVVLCVKNDLKKIKMIVSYYRKLGVEKFAVMDNGSVDGTFSWLKQQEDVDLFLSFARYQHLVKEGWINRIVSYYGFNHWYILSDSDELASYIGMEQHSLRDVISFATKNNIKKFKGIMIDMYPNGVIFGNHDNVIEEYRWMDTDTYIEEEGFAGNCIIKWYRGGPRERVMGCHAGLSKYPLCYFEEGTVSAHPHFHYPFDLLKSTECYLGILHFKFTEEDLEKYSRIARLGAGYSNNGYEYKLYMEHMQKHNNATFMYERSAEFVDSYSLKNIRFIKEMDL